MCYWANTTVLRHIKPANRNGERFIPYHEVVKRDTKIIQMRVFFSSTTILSERLLNICLATGPKSHMDISEVFLKHRFKMCIFKV